VGFGGAEPEGDDAAEEDIFLLFDNTIPLIEPLGECYKFWGWGNWLQRFREGVIKGRKFFEYSNISFF